MNYLNSTHAPLEGAIDIAYSMTNDPDYDSSTNCITGIPQFDDRFYLLPGSVGSGLGTGGTNLGLVDSTAVDISPVVINEIMYREPDDWMTGDWVELYNPQSLPQDLSGWILKDDGNEGFCIPAGTIIPGSGHLVICEDSSSFRTFYPQVKDFTGNLSFGLGRGDQVRLFSAIGERADMVSYENSFPWPVTADGTGHSLSLKDPFLDNSLPSNWQVSFPYGGTPGRQNTDQNGFQHEGSGTLRTFSLEQNYPNPFNPQTRITYTLSRSVHVTLKVFDLLGREAGVLVDDDQNPGRYHILWQPRGLASGIYLYRLQAGNFTAVKKMIYEK